MDSRVKINCQIKRSNAIGAEGKIKKNNVKHIHFNCKIENNNCLIGISPVLHIISILHFSNIKLTNVFKFCHLH